MSVCPLLVIVFVERLAVPITTPASHAWSLSRSHVLSGSAFHLSNYGGCMVCDSLWPLPAHGGCCGGTEMCLWLGPCLPLLLPSAHHGHPWLWATATNWPRPCQVQWMYLSHRRGWLQREVDWSLYDGHVRSGNPQVAASHHYRYMKALAPCALHGVLCQQWYSTSPHLECYNYTKLSKWYLRSFHQTCCSLVYCNVLTVNLHVHVVIVFGC